MRQVLFAALLAAVMVSAISVVYVNHESRKRFVVLQALERERDELNVQWSRLQLESSAWATHDRIRRVAAERLSLAPPADEATVLVTR
jgi:cell division protein FtsL